MTSASKNHINTTVASLDENDKKYTQPLITVITPCLNAISTIKETMLSVRVAKKALENSDWKLEHIVVDGGSQDGTTEWVSTYTKKEDFCRWIPNTRGGPYAAMNAGLREAKGYYTHILNADDLLLDPESYAALIIDAYQREAEILLASIGYFRRPSRWIRSVWQLKKIPEKQELWRKQLLKGLHYPHPGFIAKTDIYRKEAFDEGFSLSADYKLMQSILLERALPKTTMLCMKPLVAMDEGGITGNWRGRLRGMRQLSKINKELGITHSALRRYWGKTKQRLLRVKKPFIVPYWGSQDND